MRDYIIINGVNSLSIKGLAITKLPSIYKPIMRTEIEEIDGRNGDIITELGYGAYNKELTIGLFGDYDIDEIIAFFNQKGTIIFSNENDKVYNFDIVDQIEFEKLIKFRSATINIHCQPFKYPLSETPIEVEYENEAIINNDGNIYSKPLIDLEGTGLVTIYLNNTQMFQVDLSELNNITIDTELLEAYSDTQLANRKVVGDYSKFKLQVGTSQLKFGGALTKATITRYKRWL